MRNYDLTSYKFYLTSLCFSCWSFVCCSSLLSEKTSSFPSKVSMVNIESTDSKMFLKGVSLLKAMKPNLVLKFGYSEKGTKFEKNLTHRIWRYWVASNFKWNFFFKFCGLLRVSELYKITTAYYDEGDET